MTDLNERLAALLDDEPPAPHDLDRVVTDGRRALRRRRTLTAVAGTAGTAAITAAIVVPIAAANGGPGNAISVSTQPLPTKAPECKLYYSKALTKGDLDRSIAQLRAREDRTANQTGQTVEINVHKMKHHVVVLGVCPEGATMPKETTPPDPTAGMPAYHYTEDPQAISDRLGRELSKQVDRLGFTTVYTRPFAQESSTLEKGHPAYYDGNVDVRLPDGPADIGVQVNHAVTQLVPFDGECNPADCTRSTLADGSLLQVSHVDAGSGGAEVVVAEVHHADGLVVSAQMSNYAFGPEATRDRTKNQPLTIDQLTALAQDPAWTF